MEPTRPPNADGRIDDNQLGARASGVGKCFTDEFGPGRAPHPTGRPSGNQPRFDIELIVPAGYANGGSSAIQHVVIAFHDGQRIVAGIINHSKRCARFRTWDGLSALHRERSPGQPFLIERAEWDQALGRLERFFAKRSFDLIRTSTSIPTQLLSAIVPPPAPTPFDVLRRTASVLTSLGFGLGLVATVIGYSI